MKKIVRSKDFAISILSLACVAILGVCFFAGRPKQKPFQPDETPPGDTQTEWHAENSPDKSAGSESGPYSTPYTTPAAEDFPKVVEQTDGEVVIAFTPDAEELMPEEPEPPVTDDDLTDPAKQPSYDPEDTEVTTPEEPEDNTPAPGSGNGNGAIYDPVFGWVVPGQTHQDTVDSTGDPDKMVGNMGY